MSCPYLFRALGFFGVCTLIWACNLSDYKDLELAEQEADFAFPLFQTSINLKDLMDQVLNDTLPGDTVLANPDGTMTLIYSGDLVSKPALDLFDFFQDRLVPAPDTFYEANFADIPNSIRVDKVDFTNGIITVGGQNDFADSVYFVFSLPQLVKNGVSFRVEQKIGPKNAFAVPGASIAGYTLTADDNKLAMRYEAYLPDGTRVPLTLVIMALRSLQFSYMEGYWGYEVYPLVEDTIEIDINQTNLEGNVTVVDPKVTFTIENSWGFPTRLLVEKLVFVDPKGNEIPLESTVLDNGAIDLAYPSLTAGEVGQTKYTDVFFDKNNSNIDVIFNAQPVRLIYDIDGIANVQADPNITGFITDSSVISLLVSVEMVLEGTAMDFGADQTVDLDFGELEDLDTTKISSVEFKLLTENETPISADLQIYFLDDQELVMDSLFIGGPATAIVSAPVDANGVAYDTTRTETFIPMTATRFNRIRTASKAQLLTFFTTAQGGTVPVKLLATQDAAVKMGVRVKTKL